MAATYTKIDNTRKVAALVRELFLVGIILLLLVSPKTIRTILQNAGIKSFAGIEFRTDLEKTSNETKKAIAEISTLRDSLETLNGKLNAAIARSNDQATKNELREIQSTLTATSEKTYDLDENLKNSYSTQRSIIEQIDITEKKNSGWIYLGKIDQTKSGWERGQPENIHPVALPIDEGTLLKIKTNTYLRDYTRGPKSEGDIIGVVKEDAVVEVADVELSRARRGGWFIWARVKLN